MTTRTTTTRAPLSRISQRTSQWRHELGGAGTIRTQKADVVDSWPFDGIELLGDMAGQVITSGGNIRSVYEH